MGGGLEGGWVGIGELGFGACWWVGIGIGVWLDNYQGTPVHGSESVFFYAP